MRQSPIGLSFPWTELGWGRGSLQWEKEMPGRLVEDNYHHPSTELIGSFDIKDWWMGDRFMNC